MKSKFTNEASGLKRAGAVVGKFMGRAIGDLEAGLSAFAKLAAGHVNDALKLGADAVKAVVQKVQTITTKPFALSIKDGFAQEAVAAAPKTAVAKRTGPPRGGPKLAPV